MCYLDANGVGRIRRYVDMEGKRIKRTPSQYPYSFDEYVVEKLPDYEETDRAFYSDRFNRWYSYEKIQEGRERFDIQHGDYFWDYTELPRLEKFLSYVMNKNIHVTALLKGCNVSNGYPYWVIFYKEGDKE